MLRFEPLHIMECFSPSVGGFDVSGHYMDEAIPYSWHGAARLRDDCETLDQFKLSLFLPKKNTLPHNSSTGDVLKQRHSCHCPTIMRNFTQLCMAMCYCLHLVDLRSQHVIYSELTQFPSPGEWWCRQFTCILCISTVCAPHRYPVTDILYVYIYRTQKYTGEKLYSLVRLF